MSQGKKRKTFDAVVVGAGPNGLAAAIALAQRGHSVLTIEAASQPGGGARSEPLTLPGFTHDVCSAIHPLGRASPWFRTLRLEEHGLEWIEPDAPLAHPFDDAPAALLERSLDATADGLASDGRAYRRLMQPLIEAADALWTEILAPLHVPRHPLLLAQFGMRAIQSARGLAERWFRGRRARSLFAGMAAHSMLPLQRNLSAAFGLVLAVAGHAVGWPFPRGGAQRIADALVARFQQLGGEVALDWPVRSLEELPPARAVLLDLTPRQVLRLAGDRLPAGYARSLARYRYGPGAFKVDYALAGPIPWKDPNCRRAGTVHVGGTLEEIAAAERQVWQGRPVEKLFVLVAQQSLFDASRAPPGRHTAWAYCHVPHGSNFPMAERIEAQIERFAPGFRDLVLARHVMAPADLERHNANLIGGDINGGVQDLRQLFARPVARLVPYATPLSGLFLCSSSTPPGGGVHGMCGYHAARAALRWLDGS